MKDNERETVPHNDMFIYIFFGIIACLLHIDVFVYFLLANNFCQVVFILL